MYTEFYSVLKTGALICIGERNNLGGRLRTQAVA